MPRPKNMDSLIANSQPGKPPINRGQGFQLSTHNPNAEIETAAPPPAPPAPEPEPKLKPPTVLRESAKVDKELIRQYKVLAAQEKRKIYELMDEALRYWLEIHKPTKE